MFTGIIETTGKMTRLEHLGSNISFWIESAISSSLHPDQSVSHNGVCLTVEKVAGQSHCVTAIAETLQKTNLGDWQPGTLINLERCVAANGRFDGHFVQGHADGTAVCESVTERNGSWEFVFSYDPAFASLLVEKGSVCLNGISLTVFQVLTHQFTVAIIPYTYEHTNIQHVQPGNRVNIEFDIIGKYIQRQLVLQKNI